VEGEVEFNSVFVGICEIAEISVFHLGERLSAGENFVTRIAARSILYETTPVLRNPFAKYIFYYINLSF
jgi:hypothetical protein